MATTSENHELVERFVSFYRSYCADAISTLAQRYPNEQRSLYVDYDDLYQFDAELAEKYRTQPDQLREYAEEALRQYDLPADVKLGRAHVRVRGLTDTVDIRDIRVHDDHIGRLIAVTGIVRKATDVRPKIVEAAFECQRCGTMTYIPQTDGGFRDPHECQGCERQGPFRVNHDQSEFVDSQKIRVQESPEGLRGGETPQAIDINLEDDVTGEVTAGDHVTVTGVLHIEQMSEGGEKSPVFDLYMDGVSVEIEDEEFEDMEITPEDVERILELSEADDIYDRMVASVAPSIYGYEEEKFAMILQLFSGVTKELPDESRIRGDMHLLLVGDPGTGKCVRGETPVRLADGSRRPMREVVEEQLDDPTPVDDGVWDHADLALPTMTADGRVVEGRATRVWKREAPDRLYRVATAGGRDLVVTPSHPLFVDDDGPRPVPTAALDPGVRVAVAPEPAADGGAVARDPADHRDGRPVAWDRVTAVEPVPTDERWVYDLEVEGTHSYVSAGVVSHNSQMLSYVQNIAPRSIYTSGKGSSAAGLTASAVRDDFGDGQQWTLEAGALVLADQGIAAVDELDKMRCVTGDTLVHTPDGITPVRELALEAAESGEIERLENGRTIREVGRDVWTMTDDCRVVSRAITAVHEYDSPATLTEVTLESGERLVATDDHPFFILEAGSRTEKAATELETDDWVYVPRTIPNRLADGGSVAETVGREMTDQLSPERAAMLGYIAGDGNVYYDRSEGSYGVRFTNTEEELLAHFEDISRQAFANAVPKRYPSEQRKDGVETVRLHGKRYVDQLLGAGLNLETYDGKRVPDAVSSGTDAAKRAFVRALADSEGSVGDRNVRISSSSYELLLETKMLLLEFGVTSQIQHRERTDGRDLFVLAITAAESLEAFNDQVGFTLDRKQRALEEACERTTGDRTILDVLPECSGLFAELRESLRLYQSECGLNASTYCSFENGNSNFSLDSAETVLERFETRRERAREDLSVEGLRSWEALEELTGQYHISQRELARGTEYTQQQISRGWGNDEVVRRIVDQRVEKLLKDVADTDLARLRELVEGDVKWRRVDEITTVPPEHEDVRSRLIRERLIDLVGGDRDIVERHASEILSNQPKFGSWEELRDELDRHGISLGRVAERLDVDPSTVSRWSTGVVDTDEFDTVQSVALDLVESKRTRIRTLVDELRHRQKQKVYDLTVEGTHNFVANGAVVHNSEDRSAMHEALEQQQISISKAGINATLKSRCSLLGAANPTYGRFDPYEPLGEQIDLEPALISRFDLIFTVQDQPDPDHDADLADHILTANYAGELNTQREEMANPEATREQVESATESVDPAIDAEFLRKYIAYARRECYPSMTEAARERIKEFYVDLRAKGTDEDAPVPITARKLEALVRLAEASARVRLSDRVEERDAERVVDLVRSCLQDIGVDPETGQFDADVVETGQSKTQRDRIKSLKGLIEDIEDEYEEGAPVDEVLDRAGEIGLDPDKAEEEIQNLKKKGEVYEPSLDHLRTT